MGLNLIKIIVISMALSSPCLADESVLCQVNSNCQYSLKSKAQEDNTQSASRPIEIPGDTFYSLQTTLFNNRIQTNNRFGTLDSSINKSLSLDLSQRWGDGFRFHMIFGTHSTEYSLPTGPYKNSFINYGIDSELNATNNLSFNLGMFAGDEIIFREIQSVPVGFIVNQVRGRFMANLSLLRDKKVNFKLSLGGIAIPSISAYNFSNAYGLRYQALANVNLNKSFSLGGGLYQENINFVVDGKKQKEMESGIFLGLTWQGFYDDDQELKR